MSNLTRRRFLERSMVAATAALACGPPSKIQAAQVVKTGGPNEKFGVAVVGVRGRGEVHLREFLDRGDCEILYVCDPDLNVGRQRAGQVAKRQSREPNIVQDMRRAFDDPSVDVVSCATPNHWHALTSIWAMQAGKDIYVEKPVSHNVSEGRRIVQVARKEGRICQTGTQNRSSTAAQEAMSFLKSGGIGEVKLARGTCYNQRASIGHAPASQVPQGVDYDTWLGPAPVRPFSKNRFHYEWHWHWDYGNGDIGNQGIHQMDLARWGLGIDNLANSVVSYGGRWGYEDDGETANTQVATYQFDGKRIIFEVRGLPTAPLRGATVGNIFYGSNGFLVLDSHSNGAAFDLDGKAMRRFSGGEHHRDTATNFANFLDAVKSRQQEDLNADILQGHLSSALCHLGNISYTLGRRMPPEEARSLVGDDDESFDTFDRFAAHLQESQVDLEKDLVQIGPKLKINPRTESFIDSSAADALLTRPYRAPYRVPESGEV